MKRPRRVLLMLRPAEKIRPDYLVLCLLFLLGAALGHVAGGLVGEAQHRELGEYVMSYTRSAAAQRVPLVGVLFSYFRSPVVLFLLGLAACGAWLVPVFMAGQGFFLAFSIRCFAGALGHRGVLLALAAFGIRCLFVLPCVFYLASRSWKDAARLRKGSVIRERSGTEGRPFYPLLICGVVLLIGCTVEVSLVPRLFNLILT